MHITIHGYGSISAAGNSSEETWDTYQKGSTRWSVDGATGLPVYRVTGLPQEDAIATFCAKTNCDRASALALRAAEQAVTRADWRGKDFAVLVGCSRGPTSSWEEGFRHFQTTDRATPRTSPQTTLGGIGFALARYFGVTSLATGMSVTCSSGMHALLHGVALLQSCMVERVLVGGAEAPLTAFTLRQMEALRIYASLPAAGQHACRPLAEPPSGMVVGEGAAFLALSLSPKTEAPHISGLAFAQENSPTPTGISPTGEGLRSTMRQAIDQAGISPDLVIAHAPGTLRGDAAEHLALQSVPGTRGRAITSGKWATGHTFGASGPLGIDLGLQILKHGSATGLAYLPVDGPTASVLVNATGFGGNVVSVLLEGSK
ncbi:MAG: beta-ketoacyl synthase N-terminal-like domain-containing protein [Bacteroidota bacterium]